MNGWAKDTITKVVLEVMKSAESTMAIQEVCQGIANRSSLCFYEHNSLDFAHFV